MHLNKEERDSLYILIESQYLRKSLCSDSFPYNTQGYFLRSVYIYNIEEIMFEVSLQIK